MMEAADPIATQEVAKEKKKRGRKSKRSVDSSVRRKIEDKLEEMRLKRFIEDYCFDDI